MIALELSTFVGRFHPLFVHLPIGFLFLAIVLEWYGKLRKSKKQSRLIPAAWFLGGISAFGAAVSGWLLAETGLYEEDQLFAHRWLGVALVFISFVGWWIKSRPEKHARLLHNGFNIALLGLLFIEGHKGGNLTHGEDYLVEYAPEPIQRLLGLSKERDSLPQLGQPDSVQVYRDLVSPIFESKCVACHNEDVKRGGLNMAHTDSLQLGGQGGPVIAMGNPSESELFRRITLPQKSSKFMPPTKDVLTYDEIKIVEWWIQQGASFEDTVSQLEVSDNMRPVLLRRYGLNTAPRPWYETVQLPPLDSVKITALQKSGFTVKSLGSENPLLDIKYLGTDLTKDQMMALEKVKDYVTWLSLARTNVEDQWLNIVGQLPNLTRLQLEKTTISDQGIKHLSRLRHLEALNLYGTAVTDSCLPDIQKMEGLKRIYLWSTQVTTAKAKSLEEDNERLEVVIGEG
ncbi:MAG: c-type cytochrome domain-containing protein [Bacteroidota bacterium]